MPSTTAAERTTQLQSSGAVADVQRARVAAHGSASHPHLQALLTARHAQGSRDVVDAVHLLCHLYGRHPGLIDLALVGGAPCSMEAQNWLSEASDRFEAERLFLLRLTAAVGPLPSTAGAAETENALQAQRHAIETLARSERRGCALGAATALVSDWAAVRPLLARAAAHCSIECPSSLLPDEASVGHVIAAAIEGVAAERALAFGAEQLLFQHRGLFDLLEARSGARLD